MKKSFLFLIAFTSVLFGKEQVLILGGGIGSLTSAIYLGRAGIEPIIIEGSLPGGLITQSHSVQNWPGEKEITGTALADKIRAQAVANGAKILSEEVVSVDFTKKPYQVTVRGIGEKKTRQLQSNAIIIGMGTRPNFLGIPGEQEYWGKGISNCAICDGSLYRGKKVGVVGGGDAAVLEALYLSKIAKEVTVFIRKSSFKGIEESRIQELQKTPNIKIRFNRSVAKVTGDGSSITSVTLNSSEKVPLDGLFLAIGSTPNSEVFKNVLELDSAGYILLKNFQETSIPGIYAIGDIVDPTFKQAITAAGDGAKAAMQAERAL